MTEKRGVHYAVIYEGRNPVTGRERRRWQRCENRRDAERLAGRLTTEQERRHRAGSSMTVGDYLLGQWLPAREATVARSTHARDGKAIEHYLLPHLGDTPLRRLRPEHIRSLYQHLLIAGSRRGGPLAAKTIANLHQLIRSALRDAVDRGLLPANPVAGVQPPDPRSRPSGSRRAKSWTAAELGAFIDGTTQSQHSMLFRLTAATGMRRGEVLGLRWDDIHFDTGRIEITQALIAIGYQLEFTRLKTRTSRRNVTLDTDTLALLADWRRQQDAQLVAAGAVNEHGLVFTRPDGKPLHPHTVSQAFGRAQRHVDVSPLRFHDLRHTHASLLLRDRVPIKVVSERLGHANPAFTMTTYQHVIPGMQEDAAAAFGQLLAAHTRNSTERKAAA
ncbi:MAG: site-specific integrase [Acidimicrobiia bacterium]|nr:site-specific integrase [Acidimicrobiia bacterium]